MTEIHPKAAEAIENAQKRRASRAILEARVKNATNDGLHFVTAGKTTVCYKVSRRNVVFFATTVRHPTDRNDALLAKHSALCRFEQEQYVTVRIPRVYGGPRNYFNAIFADLDSI